MCECAFRESSPRLRREGPTHQKVEWPILHGKSRFLKDSTVILVHPHEGLLLPLIGIPTKQRVFFPWDSAIFLVGLRLQSSCISRMKFLIRGFAKRCPPSWAVLKNIISQQPNDVNDHLLWDASRPPPRIAIFLTTPGSRTKNLLGDRESPKLNLHLPWMASWVGW